jgi:Short C-terminal domain
MPRLLGAMAKTAVVAGTAQATRNAVDRRQANKNVAAYSQAEQQVYAQPAPMPQAPPMQAAPAGGMDDKLAQLERLGQLKAQGILSEEEFAQQKAAILG